VIHSHLVGAIYLTCVFHLHECPNRGGTRHSRVAWGGIVAKRGLALSVPMGALQGDEMTSPPCRHSRWVRLARFILIPNAVALAYRVMISSAGVLVGATWVLNSYAGSLFLLYVAEVIGGVGVSIVYAGRSATHSNGPPIDAD
jgi:hypothetical protein